MSLEASKSSFTQKLSQENGHTPVLLQDVSGTSLKTWKMNKQLASCKINTQPLEKVVGGRAFLHLALTRAALASLHRRVTSRCSKHDKNRNLSKKSNVLNLKAMLPQCKVNRSSQSKKSNQKQRNLPQKKSIRCLKLKENSKKLVKTAITSI